MVDMAVLYAARLGRRAHRRSSRGTKWFLFRNVPRDVSWLQTLGSATLTAFLVQATDRRDPRDVLRARPGRRAYESIAATSPITTLTLGWLVRGMHRWGASVFIILLFLHMGRVFLFGAYKYPRELNWIIGVLILATGMLDGLHRLPAAVGPERRTGSNT